MPYTLPGDSLIQVQIMGFLHGQRTRNVFHYVKNNATVLDGRAALLEFGDWFQTFVNMPILAGQSQEFLCEMLQLQAIFPTRYRAVQLGVHEQGAIEGNSLPSGVAAVVSTYAHQSGRPFQGRHYIPGIPVDRENDSQLNAAGNTWLTNVATALEGSYNSIAAGWTMTPVVSPNALPGIWTAYQLELATPRSILRYQRRREVGVGE